MNWESIGVEPGALFGVYATLALFGVGYNALTSYAERNGYISGYTALFVAGGVIVTLGLTAILFPVASVVILFGFGFSGVPMIVGSMIRNKQAERAERDAALEALRREISSGDGA